MGNAIRRVVFVSALLASPAATLEGLAATIPFSGSGTYTYVNSSFTYDGVSFATLGTGSEKANPGTATFQVVTEALSSTAACTAPDGSAGTTFNLVQSDAAAVWPKGQLYYTAAGAVSGTQCVSGTTGSDGGSVTYTVTGGTGIFTGLSGSFVLTFKGQRLAAAGNPPGSTGLFGAGQFTFSGSLTK